MEPPEASARGPRITRRRFLVGAGGLVAAGSAGAYLARSRVRNRVRSVYEDLRPAYDRTAPPGILTGARFATILALSEVLVPPRYHPGPGRVRSIVDDATTTVPGLLREYEDAARYLDELGERHRSAPSFAELPGSERNALLARSLWEYSAGPPGDRRNWVLMRLEPLLVGRSAGRLRALVARDLIARLYIEAQPLLVGYSNVPGVPGDPRAYVTPPNADP